MTLGEWVELAAIVACLFAAYVVVVIVPLMALGRRLCRWREAHRRPAPRHRHRSTLSGALTPTGDTPTEREPEVLDPAR